MDFFLHILERTLDNKYIKKKKVWLYIVAVHQHQWRQQRFTSYNKMRTKIYMMMMMMISGQSWLTNLNIRITIEKQSVSIFRSFYFIFFSAPFFAIHWELTKIKQFFVVAAVCKVRVYLKIKRQILMNFWFVYTMRMDFFSASVFYLFVSVFRCFSFVSIAFQHIEIGLNNIQLNDEMEWKMQLKSSNIFKCSKWIGVCFCPSAKLKYDIKANKESNNR